MEVLVVEVVTELLFASYSLIAPMMHDCFLSQLKLEGIYQSVFSIDFTGESTHSFPFGDILLQYHRFIRPIRYHEM